MKYINLVKGNRTKVDNEDYERLKHYTWYWNKPGYARRYIKYSGGRKTIYLHREIMNTPEGLITDHINRDKLDNRKSNLRIVSYSENGFNRKPDTNNGSGYLGVGWNKAMEKWRVQIEVLGTCVHVGFFDDPKVASEAYRSRKKRWWL
ncbi:hypothetical protein LCGC14_0615380 [marine sediment metagenome]|uniref:HNH nuclease domain-containing protein n=1 Tax=marine sediment metagenome TaxID=412755 RepID=A0A0F9UEY5_9ZZZZ